MRELTKHEKATLKNIFEELKKYVDCLSESMTQKMVVGIMCTVSVLLWNV